MRRHHARTKARPQNEPARIQDIREAKNRAVSKSTNSKHRSYSLAWDETEALGIGVDMRRSAGPGMLSEQERKEVLYKAYLNNVWISACVEVIAKRITSGGFVIEEAIQGKGIESERAELDTLLHYVNEDEDFLQLIRSIATDLLIYGEAYMEIVSRSGKPYQLHKVDCQTMSYKLDQHGNILSYLQSMPNSQETIAFQPEEIIRWWFPDPQAGKKALSPIERILGPVDADSRMQDWVRSFFRRGARPPFWIKFPGSIDEAKRFVAYLRENYTGQNNAHIPMVLYDEAELYEIGKGSIDVDFLKGRDQMRAEILAGYQVPPAAVSQIESGNIGGGTGESQDKSLQYNACDPLRQLIFEKFNYRVVQKGFGIKTWIVNCRYADFRGDDIVAKIADTRIRNGSQTVNEVRAELGKAPVDGGDEAVIVASRDVIPIARFSSLPTELAQAADLDLQTKAAQTDIIKAKASQAKNPPNPLPAQVTQGGGQPLQNIQQEDKDQTVKDAKERLEWEEVCV